MEQHPINGYVWDPRIGKWVHPLTFEPHPDPDFETSILRRGGVISPPVIIIIFVIFFVVFIITGAVIYWRYRNKKAAALRAKARKKDMAAVFKNVNMSEKAVSPNIKTLPRDLDKV